MNAMPQDYLKLLPRFTGEDEITVEKHVPTFCAFAENINVKYLDVVMRLFFQSLDGEARKWFKMLPSNSINTSKELENTFIQRWGENKYHGYFLIEFNAIKRKPNEEVVEFIKRFNKLYKSLPLQIKSPLVGAKVVFAGSFETDFGFTLREMISHPRSNQTDALEIEENMSATEKNKLKSRQTKKKNGKEETGPSNQQKDSHDQKLDEMIKVIRNLSNKLLKMELENKNPPRQIQQGQNRNFNPQKVEDKGKQPLRTIQVQQGETSKSQQIKMGQEKQVQQPMVSQQNIQKEKPTEEEKTKATKEVHSFNTKELEKVKISIPLSELVK